MIHRLRKFDKVLQICEILHLLSCKKEVVTPCLFQSAASILRITEAWNFGWKSPEQRISAEIVQNGRVLPAPLMTPTKRVTGEQYKILGFENAWQQQYLVDLNDSYPSWKPKDRNVFAIFSPFQSSAQTIGTGKWNIISYQKQITLGSPIRAIPTQSFLFWPPLRFFDVESPFSNKSISFNVFSTWWVKKFEWN